MAGTSSFGRKPFVVYWNNLPAPYMVDRFNALSAKGYVEFEAWFNDKSVNERSWKIDEKEWQFRFRYVPSVNVLGRRFHFPIPLLLSRRPDVLVSLYAEPAFLVGWFLARMLKIKTAFRVLATYDTWVQRSPMKEALKRWAFSRVDGIETTGEDGAAYARRCGASDQRIFFATHTVNMNAVSNRLTIERKNRDSSRSDLGLHGIVFLYVGRLLEKKGIFTLLRAFRSMQKAVDRDAHLLLVGDGPDEKALREYCHSNEVRNVHFVGFKQRAELIRYYAISDVFVFPTLGDPYGIVVDEAMACRLPVISTSSAGEIASRVFDGINGYVVPPGDSKAMSQAMIKIGSDSSFATSMGQKSFELVRHHTPQQWAQDFENMIKAIIGSDTHTSSVWGLR